MKNSHLKTAGVLSVLLASTVLVACEGDSRLFEEAVEIADLDIRSLTLLPPVIETTGQIIINATQDLSFGVQGITTAGAIVALSADDRRWSSSDTSVFTVSDAGVVTGVGDGEATLSVTVGSLESDVQTITVSSSALESIDSLVAIDGNPDLERCIGNEFYALGLFGDQTSRPLYEVTYTLSDDSQGKVSDTDDDTALISAYNLSSLGVVAAAGAVAPLVSSLTVLNTLTEITVTGDTDVDEGDSIELTATGAYTENSDASLSARSVNITDGVLWSIVSGTSYASIDNTSGSEGELLGIAEGSVVAQASCGTDQVAELDITINEDSDADELSFNIDRSDGLLILSLNESYQLEVTQGDEYDEDDLVTNDVVFTIINTGSTSTTISTSSISSGLIVPLTEGAEVEVYATLLDDDDEITAQGSITVRISSS